MGVLDVDLGVTEKSISSWQPADEPSPGPTMPGIWLSLQ